MYFWVLIAAGLTNILGMLSASEFFTNAAFHALSPEVFSPFGTFMVMVWGLAYLAAAKQAHKLPALCFVFAFEKAIYVYTWVVWMQTSSDTLPLLKDTSPLLALFYSGYGAIDLAYGLFFAWAGIPGVTQLIQSIRCMHHFKPKRRTDCLGAPHQIWSSHQKLTFNFPKSARS